MCKRMIVLLGFCLSGLTFAGVVGGTNCLTFLQRAQYELEYSQKSNLEVTLSQQILTAEVELQALDARLQMDCPGPSCQFTTFLYNQKQIQIFGLYASQIANDNRLFVLISLLGLQDCEP